MTSMLYVAEKEGVDNLIIGGDIIPHGLSDEKEVGKIVAQSRYLEDVFIPGIKKLKKKTGLSIYLDLGNDDLLYSRRVLESCSGDILNLLHCTKHSLSDHVDIIGYMDVPPTPFMYKDREKPDTDTVPYPHNNEITLRGRVSKSGTLEEIIIDLSSDNTIEKDLFELSELIDRPFIFVSHSPPYGTPLDVIYNGRNVGSVAIRNFIEEWSEKGLLIAAFHGHIHESPRRSGAIQTRIKNTICINPGQGNGAGSKFRYVVFRLEKDKVFLV